MTLDEWLASAMEQSNHGEARLPSIRDVWNAALEEAAKRVEGMGVMRKVWLPSEGAAAIREMKSE